MIPRRPLPPPPPSEELRAWPDEAARLADRSMALAELSRRGLGIARLLLLWLLGAVAVLGWASVGLAIQSFGEGGFDPVGGIVALILAAILLVPVAIALGFWLRKGRVIRLRLEEWADLDPAPVGEAQSLSHRRSVLWLLPSVALCLAGVGLVGIALAEASERTSKVSGTTYQVGLGVTVLLTGILGLTQALAQRRWSAQFHQPVPARRGGGSHR
ncbi:hypothetical protein ACIOHE_31070 [Streptomyces sp. NPDC087851]|uniref:hypothetical protein n=1 Tax=Streptomyces sp. NPDC087851 TaxID=3365810 RepID=UPI003806DC91